MLTDRMGSLGVLHPNFILEALNELSQGGEFQFKSNPRKLDAEREWHDIFCNLDTKDIESHFHLQQCPGCCAVLIVSYVRVHPWTQQSFDAVLQIIEEAAKMAGFGSVMMSQVVPNYSKMFWKEEAWIKCLDRGWEPSKAFRNGKSGNLVAYLTKDLEQKDKRKGLEFPVQLA